MNPYDPLPEAQEKIPPGQGKPFHPRQPSRDVDHMSNYPNERLESYTSDAGYNEYIRRKNAAADQCSGSSSGYYSSSKEAEDRRMGDVCMPSTYDAYDYDKEDKRHHSQQQPQRHRRERSIGQRSEY